MWIGILVAVIYGAVAVAANFVNKLAVKLLPAPNVILLIQTLTTLLGLQTLSALGVVRLPPPASIRVWQMAPLVVTYVIHALLVLYSLAFLSVPMYNTLKRLTPVLVLATKAVMDRRWPDVGTTLSVLLIVGGCMVAGAGDLSFDGQGYALALLCAFMQALYILLAERNSSSAATASSSSSNSSSTGVVGVGHRSSGGSGHGVGGGAGAGAGSGLGGQGRKGGDMETVEVEVAPGVRVEVELGSSGSSGRSASSATSTAAEPYKTSGSVVHVVHGGGAGGGGAGGGGSVHGVVEDGGGGGVARSPSGRSYHHYSLHAQGGQHGGAGGGGGGGGTGGSHGQGHAPMGAAEMLYSICLLGLPLVVVMCVLTGEGGRAPEMLGEVQRSMSGPAFAAWLGSTAVIEGLLTGSIILCTQLNSALTTSIVGVLKGVVSSVLGFFLLGGVKFHIVNVAGIVMNMLGGVWYSVVEYRKRQRVKG